jgi:hypothetical protein
MRERLTPNAAATEHSNELDKAHVSQIFKMYMEDIKKEERADQLGKKWLYYKSCAHAKMKREAVRVFVANAIWTIGLPRLPPFATEQRRSSAIDLSATDLEAVSEAIHNVLEWSDRIANALLNHHASPEYQEARRKSRDAHGQSGLSVTEQKTRAATRKAKLDMRTAKELAKQSNNETLTVERWQKQLLDAYWDDSLNERLKEVASQGSADTMCRTPSLAIGSATEQTIRF